MHTKDELIAKIRSIGSPPVTIGDPTPYPVISLDDFFQGNHDTGSIGANLADAHPGLETFYRVLKTVRSRHDVRDVVVEIADLNEDGIGGEGWPSSDRVYIITSASQGEVDSWVRALQPDEVAEGFPANIPAGFPPISTGQKVFGVWWD